MRHVVTLDPSDPFAPFDEWTNDGYSGTYSFRSSYSAVPS